MVKTALAGASLEKTTCPARLERSILTMEGTSPENMPK